MESISTNHHALVVGASGLIGWSAVNQLLKINSNPYHFTKITALVNRPLELDSSFWPDRAPERPPDLCLASGVNLLCGDEEFETLLKEKVPDVDSVSHVFYFAFMQDQDSEKEVEINVGMMRRAVRAVKKLSTNFKFFVYPGGTRGYGIYRPGGIFSAPLVEEMADQLPADYSKTVSYPHYRYMLSSEAAGQSWTWCELVPDTIIGFTPNGSGFSLAGHWAIYLYTYKLIHGEGAEVPFPGVKAGYDALFTETSATTLAQVAIHVSLHPNCFRERIFNVADTDKPSSMRKRWPQIASWFGLKGVMPPESASSSDLKPSDFIHAHRDKLEAAGVKGVNIWNSKQLDSYGYWLTFDRQLRLKRLRDAGFGEEVKPEEGWWEAFEMFKRAGMIG